jgi:hypothetical protein
MREKPKTRQDAFDLFPDLFKGRGSHGVNSETLPLGKQKPGGSISFDEVSARSRQRNSAVAIPRPPDVSWLPMGLPERVQPDDHRVRLALVLVADTSRRTAIVAVLNLLGYLTHTASNQHEAVDCLAQHAYSVILADIADVAPVFHEYVNRLPMHKRRCIFYALIGAQLRTLYHLEALANSVNLVIGHGELPQLEKILRVGFNDYNRLYRPILEMLHSDYPLLS